MAKAGLLFVGAADGIALWSEPGAAGRWLRVGHELRGTPVDSVWALPDNPLIVLAASGAQLRRSADGGQSWQAVEGVEGGALAGARALPGTVYCCAAGGAVYRSADEGQSWQKVGVGGWGAAGAIPAAITPDGARLYVAGGDGVWASADGGAGWSRVGALPAATHVAALQGGLVALAAGRLYRSEQGGAWEPLAAPEGAVSLAALAGKRPTLLLGLQEGGVARSDDMGATWETVSVGAAWAGTAVVLHAAIYHIDTAFAGSSAGNVALSTDRGSTWQTLKGELPPIRSIAAARLV